MNKESLLTAAARVIANRVPGPFRETGGLPGETARSRFDTAARAYLWNRYVRKLPAARALELAAPVALLPHTVRTPQWYGTTGGLAGAVWTRSGDSFRWIENTAGLGLRFIAWADELPGGPVHTGWYTRADDFEDTNRGGVWQLSGRNGRARIVYGYAEFEGRGEMNPGSAAICVSDVLEINRRGEDSAYDCQRDADAMRDAARWADGIAESEAKTAREYDFAYQAGREAAEHDAEALDARKEALLLIRELKAALRVPMARAAFPTACKALRERIDSLLETISEAREKRDSLWDDCWSGQAEAWRAGFADNADGGFVRAVRLGYAKATDWQGPPDRNPCNAEAGA